jgi:hypothetical protein
MKYFALLGVLLVMVACAGKTDHGNLIVDNGGSGGRSAHAGSGGAGAGAGAGAGGDSGAAGAPPDVGAAGAPDESGLAPVVEITSPTAVVDPSVGPVILDHVRVVCSCVKGSNRAATFASSSVSIEALDAAGKSIQKTAGTPNLDNATEFFSDFSLSAAQVPNGAISFRCSADDMSNPPLSGSSVVTTLIDHGPNISVVTPALPTVASPVDYYALGVVPFKFSVLPAPLAAADPQAEVDAVTLTVNNVPIDISKAEDSANPGNYKIDINLADPIKFKVVPNGATSIAITATNKRKPLPVDHTGPVTATLAYNFGIDGAGPKISITSPSVSNSPVLGRSAKIQFTILDTQSGVDASTVTVKLNSQQTYVYDPVTWTRDGDAYSFTIVDTTSVIGSTVQLSVDVEASDLAKNKALPATAQYWLDTTPPVLDLDPPRVVEVNNLTPRQCSAPFDPVGDASPDDGQGIPAGSIFRALVWDETNLASGVNVHHYAGIDPSSVRLYAQADQSQPLLTAVHGGSVCDDLITDGMHPPVPFQLFPLDAAGSAFYGSKGSDVSTAVQGVCVAGTATTPPDNLCTRMSSDMFRVIDHATDVKEDVIYTATSGVGVECTGKALVLSASVPNGWVCLAARAVDNAGNVGISAPIRVCLYDDSRPAPDCATSSMPMPTCVNNCTPPDHFGGAASLVYIGSSH